MNRTAARAIEALRKPDASLNRVPNTVRQSIADVVEETTKQLDKYGLALMMIREGCADPAGVAREALLGPWSISIPPQPSPSAEQGG